LLTFFTDNKNNKSYTEQQITVGQQQWEVGHKTQRRRLNFITSTKNLAADTKQRGMGMVFEGGLDIMDGGTHCIAWIP